MMEPIYLEMKSQLQATLDELERNKATNKYLQIKIMKQELRNYLVEHDNHSLKDQKKELQKMLIDKDKEIAHLKSHSQNLEDKIRNSKNVEESPYRSNNDLEEETKILNKIIKEKENQAHSDESKRTRSREFPPSTTY